MQITNPRNGETGFYVTWIVKDHEPKEDEEYDPVSAELGEAVFSELDEAKDFLKEAWKEGGVQWGTIHGAVFEWLEGHPYVWNYEHRPLLFLEEIN